jgi:hypothetical protein
MTKHGAIRVAFDERTHGFLAAQFCAVGENKNQNESVARASKAHAGFKHEDCIVPAIPSQG